MVLNIISVIVGLFVAAFVDAALNTTDDEVEKHYEDYNSVPLKPRGRAAELSKNDNAFSKGYQDGKTFDPDRKRIGRKGNK